MNEEIKELLVLLHNDNLSSSGKRKLEDFLINLQTDNKRLQHNEKVYKSRIDKAIEYIKIGLSNYDEAEELLNILQGSDSND